MEREPGIQVDLIFTADTTPSFARLFSKGVIIEASTGCSLEEFLCRQFGIEESYLDQRIQTIFLNGKPVDDYRKTIVSDGDVLALSAAMPGLAGATLRRGGFYAAMRGTITHHADSAETCTTAGRVTVKVFNLLVPEIGPNLLKRGIQIDAEALWELFNDYQDSFRRGCRQVLLNGEKSTFDALPRKVDHTGIVSLRISESL